MLECDPKSPPQFETLDAATQENIKDVGELIVARIILLMLQERGKKEKTANKPALNVVFHYWVTRQGLNWKKISHDSSSKS